MTNAEIKKKLNLDVCARTVGRRLTENNLLARAARKVPHLSTTNVKKRIAFAHEHLDEAKEKWRNILWSDETKINLFGSDGKRYVRRPANEQFNPKYTKKTVKYGGGSIMVWGCFSWYGVGPLHRIKGIMDAVYYRKILRTVMLPYADENMPLKWRFQQDNDPKHTSGLVKDWFAHKNIDVLRWVSQSPDLNPIENLWNHVKKEIAKRDKPSNKENLWEIVQEVWNSIPIEVCQKLVDSMPNRCEEIIRNKGYTINY